MQFLGLLLLYDKYDDVFDEDKDALDEISLENILVIESSTEDPKDFDSIDLTQDPSENSEKLENSKTKNTETPTIDCLFDVHARVQFGGDSNGIRVFSFYSHDSQNTTDWMENLCKTVGFLDLLPASGGGFVSVVSEAALVERKEQQLKRQVAMMRKGSTGREGDLRRLSNTIATLPEEEKGVPISPMGRGRGRGRGFIGQQSNSNNENLNNNLENVHVNERKSVEEENKREKLILEAHRNMFRGSPLSKGGQGGPGRGRGRGLNIRANQSLSPVNTSNLTRNQIQILGQGPGQGLGQASSQSMSESERRSSLAKSELESENDNENGVEEGKEMREDSLLADGSCLNDTEHSRNTDEECSVNNSRDNSRRESEISEFSTSEKSTEGRRISAASILMDEKHLSILNSGLHSGTGRGKAFMGRGRGR